MIQLVGQTRKIENEYLLKSEEALKKLFNKKDIGFFQLPERSQNWTESQEYGRKLAQKYDRMVVIGIGGSSLGGRVILEVLQKHNSKEVMFFENVDAQDFWTQLNSLDRLDKTCWVVISKSGGTIETLANANFIHQYLEEKKINMAQHSCVVSEKKENPLTNWARKNSIPILEIPEDVGGRFSVLTPVGLLPAAFLGADLDKIRHGAAQILTQKDLIHQLMAHSLQSWKNEEWITVFWQYCSRLRWFGGWVQQLWAESLGKKINNENQNAPRVSTPLGCVGANDQHSLLQQIAEGYKDKFIWFLRVKESENFGAHLKQSVFSNQKNLEGKGMGELLAAEAMATGQALEQGGIHSLTLLVDKLNEQSLGELFMLMELVVGGLGEALNINAFDQPGVELGKRLAKKILENS